MVEKVWVKAGPMEDPALAGLRRVTKEGTANRFITEQEAVEVELTGYYMRRINRGELIRCDPDKPVAMKSSPGANSRTLTDRSKR